MIQKVWVKHYRNLAEHSLNLSPHRHYFVYGDNNQGKTNFLEALYLLGHGASPIERDLGNLVQFDHDEACLGVDVTRDDEMVRIYFRLSSDRKRELFVNNEPVRRFSALSSYINIEYLSSDVIRLFHDSPDVRRRELDRFLSRRFSRYSEVLKRYQAIVKQKTQLLKSDHATSDSVDVWTQQLIAQSEKVVAVRLQGIELLRQELFQLATQFDSDLVNEVSIDYLGFGDSYGEGALSEYQERLRQKCREGQHKELASKQCLYGPHRDDFEILVNTRSLFRFFSKGINRVFAILFKVAQLSQLESSNGGFPVLLLDDALAEVDFENKKHVMALLDTKTRVFYSSVLASDSELLPDFGTLHVRSGELVYG